MRNRYGDKIKDDKVDFKIESVEDFKKRGGIVKQVDFKDAYKRKELFMTVINPEKVKK